MKYIYQIQRKSNHFFDYALILFPVCVLNNDYSMGNLNWLKMYDFVKCILIRSLLEKLRVIVHTLIAVV